MAILNKFKSSTIFEPGYRHQILATLILHFLTYSYGISLGWVAPTLHVLQSDESPVQFDITTTDVSWIGSLYGLGGLAGNVIFGMLLNTAGRKWCLKLMAVPHMLFWILVYFAKSVDHLYWARFLSGLTPGGIYIVVPIFVSEIADANIRGCLSAISMFFHSFGILTGFVMTSYLGYHLIPCIVMIFPVLYLLATCLIPETAQFLLRKGKITQAEKSFRFYKNIKGKRQHLTEFEELKESLTSLDADGNSLRVTIGDFMTKRAILGLLTSLVLISLNQYSGSSAVVSYMTQIFVESGSSMDPFMCTIVEGIAQIVGTLTGTFLVDYYGRKTLILTSALGMSAALTVFGAYLQFTPADIKSQLEWMPLVMMTVIVFVGGFGVVALVFTIVVEVLPLKIRSSATPMCMAYLSISVFGSVKLYPYLIYNFGVAITMFACASVCLLCALYLIGFLPETKGKSMDFEE